jgi:hypothetical protein
LYQSPLTDPVQKLAAIRRIALAHNSAAVNVGAHRLAGLVLEVIGGDYTRPAPDAREAADAKASGVSTLTPKRRWLSRKLLV